MKSCRWNVVAPVLAAIVLLSTPRAAWSQRIAVLTTDSLTSTQRSVTGEKSVIRAQNPQAEFREFFLKPGVTTEPKILDSIKAFNPGLFLTVGSAATQFAQTNFKSTPVVFCAVMYPVISGFVESFAHPGGNITGSSLSIPADIQFRYFKQIVPKLGRLGVLYTDNTASLIPPTKAIAQQMGLKLVAIKIDNERQLAPALDSLAGNVDGIWSVADPNLFNPQSTKFILINALRRGLPLMGFSRNVVESGALFALDFDYKAIGRQAGELANQILIGASAGSLSVTTPDIIWFHYNEKTAQHMSITIPQELVAIAKEVYR
ncbi:MAG: ABC transporter substrate-binding protein [Candidatus Zixiibacteriota bacterium]